MTAADHRVHGAAHYPGSLHRTPARAFARLLSGWLVASTFYLLAGCGAHQSVQATKRSNPPPARDWPVVASARSADANAILMRALSLVGTPYRYGGNTPEEGFDCSGLVDYVFRDMLDLRLPRSSRELAAQQGTRIAQDRLVPADLVFFGSGGEVTHVGIYVGEGRFVHAPRTGGTVRLDRLDGAYWRDHYSGGARLLR